jgi:hypothetical protein
MTDVLVIQLLFHKIEKLKERMKQIEGLSERLKAVEDKLTSKALCLSALTRGKGVV